MNDKKRSIGVWSCLRLKSGNLTTHPHMHHCQHRGRALPKYSASCAGILLVHHHIHHPNRLLLESSHHPNRLPPESSNGPISPVSSHLAVDTLPSLCQTTTSLTLPLTLPSLLLACPRACGEADGYPRERECSQRRQAKVSAVPSIILPRIAAQCRTHQQSPLSRELPAALLLTLPALSATPRPRVSNVHLRVCSPFLYLTCARQFL